VCFSINFFNHSIRIPPYFFILVSASLGFAPLYALAFKKSSKKTPLGVLIITTAHNVSVIAILLPFWQYRYQ
jgi:hypothetical protein